MSATLNATPAVRSLYIDAHEIREGDLIEVRYPSAFEFRMVVQNIEQDDDDTLGFDGLAAGPFFWEPIQQGELTTVYTDGFTSAVSGPTGHGDAKFRLLRRGTFETIDFATYETQRAVEAAKQAEREKHSRAVDDAAGRIRVGRDAKRQVLVEDGAFGLFDQAQVVTIDNLMLRPEVPDLVAGVLGAGELSMLFGESYSGKSFLALDWALCIATGQDWHGSPVQQGRVLYLAMEGVTTLKRRVEAWTEAHGGIDPGGFDVYPHVVSLMDDDTVSLLRKRVAEGDYSLVVVDTLSRSFGGGNESDTEAMGAYVAALSKIREASDETTVLVIHHSKKDAPDEYRGSTVLFAALDRVMCLTMGSPTAPERKLASQKVKSGELTPSVGLRFTPSAESAVLVPYAVEAAEPVEVTVWRSLAQPVTRAALHDALIERGHVASMGTARNRVGKLIGSHFEERREGEGPKALYLAGDLAGSAPV